MEVRGWLMVTYRIRQETIGTPDVRSLIQALVFQFCTYFHTENRLDTPNTPYDMAIIGGKEELGDPRLTRIAQADDIPWYQKPNLRLLYLIMIPTCLGVEWTSGFDSSMMNSLQAVKSWTDCAFSFPFPSPFSPR
jgi:hypothetical protein